MDCTALNERHRTRLACCRPGAGVHKDIERGKVPSAARVACIARSVCTSLDQNSNKYNFSEQSDTDCRIYKGASRRAALAARRFARRLHAMSSAVVVFAI